MNTTWNPHGTHVIAELSRCQNIARYDDTEELLRLMEGIVAEAGLSQVSQDVHKFEPHGISCTIILQESHMATHISPEIGYAALDIYTCNVENFKKTIEAARLFAQALGAEVVTTVTLLRGQESENGPGCYDLSLLGPGIVRNLTVPLPTQ